MSAVSRRRPARETRPPSHEAADLLQPVPLVEDHRVVLGQHPAAGRDVREVERVVDDHEVGPRGAFLRRFGEAGGDERAAAPRAAIGPDCDLRP